MQYTFSYCLFILKLPIAWEFIGAKVCSEHYRRIHFVGKLKLHFYCIILYHNCVLRIVLLYHSYILHLIAWFYVFLCKKGEFSLISPLLIRFGKCLFGTNKYLQKISKQQINLPYNITKDNWKNKFSTFLGMLF